VERPLRVGSSVFAVGITAFGVVNLVRLDLLPDIEPLPASVPGRLFLAVLSGVVLVASGAAILTGLRARLGATAAALFLSLCVLPLHVAAVAMHPGNGGAWVVFSEVLGLSAAVWMLAATLAQDDAPSRGLGAYLAHQADAVSATARVCFGASFLVFGMSHFLYLGYVESVIPAWIPFHRFWALATGVAHLAAGVSILTRVKARLAATLLAIMFGSWVVIVHAPRLIAAQENSGEWTSLIVALAFCGASWIAAETFARAGSASASRQLGPRADPSRAARAPARVGQSA
jgi:uncharacterized membrane protein